MDRQQFNNAIKHQDLHILDVSSSPPDMYVDLVRKSDYVDYIYAKVVSERFCDSAYIAIGLPFKLTELNMNIGMARQMAARILNEMLELENKREKAESLQ